MERVLSNSLRRSCVRFGLRRNLSFAYSKDRTYNFPKFVPRGPTSLLSLLSDDVTCRKCISRRVSLLSSEIRQEVLSYHRLLLRSGFHRLPDEDVCRGLIRQFSSSSKNHQHTPQRPNDKDEDKQEGEDDDKKNERPSDQLLNTVTAIAMIIVLLEIIQGFSGPDPVKNKQRRFISWQEFQQEMLNKGEVEEVIVAKEIDAIYVKLLPGAVVKGKKQVPDVIYVLKYDSAKFEDRVRKAERELGLKPEQGIPISYHAPSKVAELLSHLFWTGIILYILYRVGRGMTAPQISDMFASQRKAKFVRADLLPSSANKISFKDVAGLHEAKTEVMEFVDYLKRPQRYKELGARIPKGALLLGPPGCGKTLLAKAVASEAHVPFLAMAGSEFVEMIGGLGAARVRDLFQEARKNQPCIIYLDEIDAIGRQRSGSGGGESGEGGQGEGEQTLNQLLVEMDGMGTTDGVIVLASTNRADILDKALLRPGRFDRHIMIDLPTLDEREETFEMYLQKLRTVQAPRFYSKSLAQLTPGMSGADIANICNEAALHAARTTKKSVDTVDFDYAVERVLAGVAKKSRILTEQEKKVVAYHEAGHAVVSWLQKYSDSLLKVSIVPRTNSQLGFSQYQVTDRKLYSNDLLFEQMCQALGGRVAESLTFNRISSAAQDDLKKVTTLAYRQMSMLGMNQEVGLVSFPPEQTDGFVNKPYSKRMAKIIDMEAKKLVAEAFHKTQGMLTENKEKLRIIAEALLEKETLKYSDMEELIGPQPNRNK